MKFVPWCLLVLLLFQITTGKKRRHKGTQWWSLAKTGEPSNDLYSPTAQAHIFSSPTLLPLTKKQRRLVTKNPGTILAIAKGARMAVDECQNQFEDRRWNCSIQENGHGGSIFGKIIERGCRETAFIYAITSAAVAHSVARACADGSIYTCTCNYNLRQPHGVDWEWGGCSDNANFGKKFSRKFVDVAEKGRDFRYMMNLHNNEAGRRHIKREMERDCKCHGMSGSCTIKTCWMRLPVFRKVGDILKDRFDGASRVLPGNEGRNDAEANNNGGRRSKKKLKLEPADPNHKRPDKRDLVYFEESPDFCEADDSAGTLGTVGRECNATSIGIDGCDLMCCGRGYKSETYTVRERCSCTFHWCCEVKCKICTRTKIRHTCL
ncbi:protein Wnt-1-like [Ruditapes philippinarum]|uniref:protein Wnt-1-like n=1 Tax=Ruditapes philippinarum TaxID=129788 RepID=UPI00295C0976|nr:protein Wnt-1-like [Ruditapes philippinarum]